MERRIGQRGFTLVELVTVVVLLAIMAALVMPRFFSPEVFTSRGFYDQVIATLRYAQKAAVAKHRFVCVQTTASTLALTYGATAACADGPLTDPVGGGPYSISAPGGITLSASVPAFGFNALGQPSFSGAPATVAISGYAAVIRVEAETGYVH